jgi:hypothetical protein
MPPKISDRLAALKQKQEALAKQMSVLQQKEKAEARKRDTRRKIIVGGLVLGYMEKDPAFADLVRGLIAKGVTRPHDVAAVVELLPPELVAALLAAPAANASAPAPQEEFRQAAAR